MPKCLPRYADHKADGPQIPMRSDTGMHVHLAAGHALVTRVSSLREGKGIKVD